MKKRLNLCRTSIKLVLSILILSSCSQKQNWPQFRGPENNMLPASRNLPLEWGNDKNIKWTAAFEGTGYSSPVVWGDRVIITSAVGEKVNPVPERGPVQGPPQQGGPGAQPGQMSQPGQGPQPGQMPQAGQGPQPGQPGPQPEIARTARTMKMATAQYDLLILPPLL